MTFTTFASYSQRQLCLGRLTTLPISHREYRMLRIAFTSNCWIIFCSQRSELNEESDHESSRDYDHESYKDVYEEVSCLPGVANSSQDEATNRCFGEACANIICTSTISVHFAKLDCYTGVRVPMCQPSPLATW